MIKVLHVNIQKNGYTNMSHATQANIQNIVVNTSSQHQKNRLSKKSIQNTHVPRRQS